MSDQCETYIGDIPIDRSNYNALQEAINEQNLDQVKRLLEIVRPYYRHVESLASIKDKEIIKLVLNGYGSRGPYILISECLRKGNLELIKWLLEEYSFSGDNLVTLQIRALYAKNVEAAEILSKYGSKIDLDSNIIREISQSGSIEVLKFLMDNYELKLEDIDPISLACFFVDHLKEWILEKAPKVLDTISNDKKVRDL